MAVWFMNGGILGGSGVLGSPGTDYEIEFVADLNGDGCVDVVFVNKTTGEVLVWLLDGLTVIGSGSPGMVSTDWEI